VSAEPPVRERVIAGRPAHRGVHQWRLVSMAKPFVYPYIPNSVPEVKERMMREVGISSLEDVWKEIPEHLRFKRRLNTPGPIPSEYALQRHVEGLLNENWNCKNNVSFLGGGCWQHHVPAVVTTIMGRDEFLTAYVGEAFADLGKFQAQFEFASCIGELVGMDMVNTPTYDWGMAAATSIRMASRITGRSEAVVVGPVSPDRLACMKNYAFSIVPTFVEVAHDPSTGLEALRAAVTDQTACVYFENPSYLGFIEVHAAEIAKIAHAKGAVVAVGVDPNSLGVLEAPANYGADIVVGDVQGLGIPMYWGGGLGGFVATRDEPAYVAEFPSLLYGLTTTTQEGEYGFGEVYYERTSYASREKAKDFLGTMAQLHGIGAGVYLSLMGPQGMKELGEGIMQRVAYLIGRLAEVPGVKAPAFAGPHFKEFVVNFDGTGKTVKEINKRLLGSHIFGGKDLTRWFPTLGQSALFCVTEVHTKDDLDKLVDALKDVVKAS
jgi:glycine dehydrogenase subunit 1